MNVFSWLTHQNTQQSILGFVVSVATWLYNTSRPSTLLWYCISSRVRCDDTAGWSLHLRCVTKNPFSLLFFPFFLHLSLSLTPQWCCKSLRWSSIRSSSMSWSSRATTITPGRTASAGAPPSCASAALSSSAACRATRTSWLAWLRPSTSTPPTRSPSCHHYGCSRLFFFSSYFIRSSRPGPHFALTIER